MSNVYCTNCGTKNVVGSKFCFQCGNQMSQLNVNKSFSRTEKVFPKPTQEYDEDGIPTVFVKPQRLSYEIEKSKSKYSVSEILSVPPSQDRINSQIDPNFKIPSTEEYLKQSLHECRSTRNPQDVNET